MHYHHLHKGINTIDVQLHHEKNLVNFGLVTPEITFLICGYLVKIGLQSPFVALAFPNAFDD